MSEFDLENVGAIMKGNLRDASNFTAELLRLIAKADPINRARLRGAFPREVEAYEAWFWGLHEEEVSR